MKYIDILLLASLTAGSAAQFERRHGLLNNWGKGSMTGLQHNIGDDFSDGILKATSVASTYNYNVALGYRFRLKMSNPKLFYDADLTLGLKKYSYIVHMLPTDKYETGTPVHRFPGGFYYSYHVSLALSCNYLLYKGLYAGAGIEPSFRYRTEISVSPPVNRTDVPVFAKIGYDFRFIDISFAYKMGLTDMMRDKNLTSGRINDWQMQLFIPF
jgi:hypothetical protein